MDQNDCVAADEARPLKKCGETSLHCCPSNHLSLAPPVATKFPTDCGNTPMYPKQQIVGGKIISPDEYSWLGSLQYGNKGTYGLCGGSVINSRYVLTAAHCVTGDDIKRVGGL